jgi:GNAT superfamily N-acetyltransferase
MANGFQGMGLGRRLLEEITKHFPAALGVELYTRISNRGAMHFYASCGLQTVNNISGSLRAKDWLLRPGLYPPDDDLISAHHETYQGFHGRLTTRPVTLG